MADDPNISAQDEKPGTQDAALVKYWTDQIAAYDDEFKPWLDRCRKIIRRYRDERQADSNGTPQPSGARFNALWSNIQTLQPAIYLKAPQPVAERRYLDKDPLARISSMTLERALEVQIEVGYLHPSMQKSVLDYLLCGRGTLWERYEPTYGAPEDLGSQPQANESTNATQDAGLAPRPVTYEKVCTDYVAWDKFKHSPSPVWEEVWWVAKEEMLTRKEMRARFKGIDKETGRPIADLVPLRDGSKDKESDKEKKRRQPRACVVEIWDKSEKKVIFIAPDWQNAPLEVTDDPLQLESFWPCPKPLYATTTNDCLVPVPDYVEYQDQADELDDLTARIKALTDAVRVNGVYDASIPELKRILSEGADNRMIGVAKYSEFAQKGGLEASVDFVPIKDVVEALIRLYEARDRVKADMAEITGLSDIIRGQAQGTAKTATEQRIKGQFASLRLEDRKKEVARFAGDAIRIAAEIISEQFSPEILAEMTGMLPLIADELKAEAPPAPPQQPQMGHNGGPPLEAEPGVSPPPVDGAAGGMPPAPGLQPPPPDFNALAQKRFMEACALLKNDKMRTFRIDIETDSTVEVDKQAAKESVVEMFTAVGGFLEKSIPIAQAVPQLMPALGQSVLFAFRRFGAGRDVEGVWEQAIEQLSQAAKNPAPKPPSPEEVKAQGEKQKAELNAQSMQQKAALDKQKGEQDLALSQQKAQIELMKAQAQLQIDQQKLQLERERMEMERQRMGMELQVDQQKMAIETEAAERDAEINERAAVRDDEMAERAAERDAEAGEHEFELGEKVREAKAKEAMQPNPKVKA
jgi:hypothetical protein